MVEGKSFLPFKSPGLDGIFPALFHCGLEVILVCFVIILRACIAFRYIIQVWREVKVIFIPKPGHSDYSLTKFYRPISLTSFLLKTLDKLCDSDQETTFVCTPTPLKSTHVHTGTVC